LALGFLGQDGRAMSATGSACSGFQQRPGVKGSARRAAARNGESLVWPGQGQVFILMPSLGWMQPDAWIGRGRRPASCLWSERCPRCDRHSAGTRPRRRQTPNHYPGAA
jgi:hypothetical protein